MQFSESGSSGNWLTSSAQFVDVPNLRISITTVGGPVFIQLVSAGAGEPSGYIGCVNQGARVTFGFFRFARDGVALPSMAIGASLDGAGGGETLFLPCSTLSTIDRPPAGAHFYTLQARAAHGISGGPHATSVNEAKLVAIAD